MTIRISGTGSALPERILTNHDLEQMVETSDEWIRERTGIRERHIADGDTVASLAADACSKALADAGKQAEDVDLIIAATCSNEMLLPCAGCRIQSRIGAHRATAFDLNAACAGFLFALQTAQAYIASGIYRNALIVGAEVLSGIVDWSDRSTCVLFGDGAGAVFVEECNEEGRGILSLCQGSDGSRGNVLYCRERPVAAGKSAGGTTGEPDPFESTDTFVHMNGAEVYKFAVRQVPECIDEVLETAGLSAGEIDHFVLHQANLRIIEAIAKRLGVAPERFPVNLDRVGNTSSAAIPILLDELNKCGKIKPGDRLVLSGFGAGLTYGACALRW